MRARRVAKSKKVGAQGIEPWTSSVWRVRMAPSLPVTRCSDAPLVSDFGGLYECPARDAELTLEKTN